MSNDSFCQKISEILLMLYSTFISVNSYLPKKILDLVYSFFVKYGLIDLLQKCFLDSCGQREKVKGERENTKPFPLFPTYARNLMCRNLQEFYQNIFESIVHLIVDIETHPLNSL